MISNFEGTECSFVIMRLLAAISQLWLAKPRHGPGEQF